MPLEGGIADAGAVVLWKLRRGVRGPRVTRGECRPMGAQHPPGDTHLRGRRQARAGASGSAASAASRSDSENSGSSSLPARYAS